VGLESSSKDRKECIRWFKNSFGSRDGALFLPLYQTLGLLFPAAFS